LQSLDSLGLYLHIPFCRQICPYCPYNKTLLHDDLAARYVDAVCREIEMYAPLLRGKAITSFYIGGGTPTTLLDRGLDRLLAHIFDSFDMHCSIHMESHPNDLNESALDRIEALGVDDLSMGIEALQEHHLRTLRRPYTVEQAVDALARALRRSFTCVNADLMFALPGQKRAEVREAVQTLVDLGVDQVATYPLFEFPYTAWERTRTDGRVTGRPAGILERRRMLREIERVLYANGYRRTSVWAFTRDGIDKYCSVTVPTYIGLGASGSSYLRQWFYLNTFDVPAYCEAIEAGRLPIALSIELTERMQMAGWFYWRLYETEFRPAAFERRFGRPIDQVFGRNLDILSSVCWLRRRNGTLQLTDGGAYWLHVLQNVLSIKGIGELWGASVHEPWPHEVVLS